MSAILVNEGEFVEIEQQAAGVGQAMFGGVGDEVGGLLRSRWAAGGAGECLANRSRPASVSLLNVAGEVSCHSHHQFVVKQRQGLQGGDGVVALGHQLRGVGAV